MRQSNEKLGRAQEYLSQAVTGTCHTYHRLAHSPGGQQWQYSSRQMVHCLLSDRGDPLWLQGATRTGGGGKQGKERHRRKPQEDHCTLQADRSGQCEPHWCNCNAPTSCCCESPSTIVPNTHLLRLGCIVVDGRQAMCAVLVAARGNAAEILINQIAAAQSMGQGTWHSGPVCVYRVNRPNLASQHHELFLTQEKCFTVPCLPC